MACSIDHLQLPSGSDLDILLVGITGHGKSATGNSILRRNEFASSDGLNSVTKDSCAGCSKIDGRILRVVDTPGFDDTDENDKESVNLVIKSLIASLTECPQGFDAIILVLKCDGRFRPRDRKTVDFWMGMIGKDNFLSHGIMVVTAGDTLVSDSNDPEVIIKNWWKKQSVDNQLILEKCGGRSVLFYNKSTDFLISRTQLFNLISKIHNLPNKNRCIPKCCQLSDKQRKNIKEAERTLVENISEFNKKFSLLKNGVTDLSSEDDRLDIFNQITKDAENLRKQLMEKENEQIYEAVKVKLSAFEEKLPELKNLDEFPSSEKMAKDFLCNLIAEIQNEMNVIKEDTIYWQMVQKKVVSFLKDFVPLILGAGAAAIGVGIVIPGVNVIVGGAVAIAGGVTALGGGIALLVRKIRDKKSKDEDKTNTG